VLGIHDRQELRDIGDPGEVDALAEIIVGGDREDAELGEAPRHVLDVFVQAENLHRHQHDRRIGVALRSRVVAGHLAVGDLDLGVAGIEPIGVGLDDIGAHGTGGERVAGRHSGGRRHETAARERRGLCQSDDIGCE
jgi:hypothetical protein